MNIAPHKTPALARNVRRLGHLDLPGAGQVCVAGKYAYVGHLPSKSLLGTSIIDISDPSNPTSTRQCSASMHVSSFAPPIGRNR